VGASTIDSAVGARLARSALAAADRVGPAARTPLPATLSGLQSNALPAVERDKIRPLTFDQLPFVERNAAGQPVRGLAIDRWVYSNGVLLLSGWVIGVDSEQAPTASDVKVAVFQRPDVEHGFPALRESARGLLAIVPLGDAGTFNLFGFTLEPPPRQDADDASEVFLLEHRQRFGFLLRYLPQDCPEYAIAAAQAPAAPDTYKRARGFLEHARGVVDHGGIVIGWAVNLPGVQLVLLDQAGHLVPLDGAIRWFREDIVEAFGRDFGNYTFNTGMLQAWRAPFKVGAEIRLVALDGDAAFVLAITRWDAAPIEPTSFARWAFELPTPLDQFAERMERHDGAIIESLIARDRSSWHTTKPDVHQYGTPVENPRCSIVVPLYGRFDFMLNQLLEFSEDEQIRQGADLIYVVDDPRIASQVIQQAWLLYEANRVPFRIVVAPENRGFAGANNLGISVSRAPALLLLNSDVIPVEAGWLGKMLAELERSRDVGIIGARLFYSNGSIQHDGMAFQWEPSWGAFLNKHPRSGMEAAVGAAPGTDHPSVTAACLMISRSTYDAVGGLDEGFLIGDFEDSDLCLKVRQRGLRILCLSDVNLTHLERQSFTGIGANGFRERVARYNAWRHQRRWSAAIEALGSSRLVGASK
jgi:GT2 family glycosyltransferase